jgi:hypothetical protein
MQVGPLCAYTIDEAFGIYTDEQEVKHTGSAAGEEAYAITANLDKGVQITATFTRAADAPGFKYGEGEKGGFSFLGKDKTDGFVVQYVSTRGKR